MKTYRKIHRQDNSNRLLKKGEVIRIQEKIDGSNIAFGKINDEFKMYSRTKEILKGDSNFGRLYDELSSTNWLLDNNHLFFGEYIKQGKIKYKKNFKNERDRVYVFDYAEVLGEGKDEYKHGEMRFELEYKTLINAQTLNTLCMVGVNIIPELDTIIFDGDYEKLKTNYVDNKKSTLDGESIIEGIVAKSEDSKFAIKVVGNEFLEYKKEKKTKGRLNGIIDCFLTFARIEKYINRLIEKGIIKSDYGVEDYQSIFKNSKDLIDDIYEEEESIIITRVKAELKRTAAVHLKKFLDEKDQKIEENEKF